MSSFAAIDRNGNSLNLDAARVETLRGALRGMLLGANDAGYQEARAVWNGMIDRKPALIARCIGTADIVACVNFARETGIALSMKGGGHNIAGLALAEGGLVIDCSLMRGCYLDLKDRVVHTQPGATLGDADRETQVHGLAAILGFVSLTGVTGLTLGGGFGYLSRRYGWTSDNVRSMTMVTTEGKVVKASPAENADLFWGLRGGGGNFGVVTDIEHQLYPIGPEIYGGGIAWTADSADEVFKLYHQLAEAAPQELSAVCAMRIAPPAPWIAKEAHGKPIIAMFLCHCGRVEDAEKLLAPVKAFGKPVGDTVMRRSYVSQQCLLDATQPKGRRYYWKAEYLPGVSQEIYESVKKHALAMPSPHSAVILFPLGGAIGQHVNSHSAVGNRNANFVLNITGAWDKAEDDTANVEWARTAWNDTKKFSTGGTYINFLTEEEAGERIHAAYGGNYERIARVKAAWDPQNMFRMNKNVQPVA
ncbi:MAG TPA: FAD-binding oxidoreductase [Candidatus Krumholzibacteria bacterium]|nr:FAD-binding oxidoreductase [Candidatus Krumholzibacteria bacterium]